MKALEKVMSLIIFCYLFMKAFFKYGFKIRPCGNTGKFTMTNFNGVPTLWFDTKDKSTHIAK